SSEGRFILIIANIRTYEVYYLYDMNEQDDYSFNVDGYRHSYSDSLENAKKNFANNLLWLEGTSYTKDGYFELDDCSWRENLPEMEHYYYMNNPPEMVPKIRTEKSINFVFKWKRKIQLEDVASSTQSSNRRPWKW
ncbi:MAG TPA: hypothetical protein PKO16_09300, partial [Bacteroidia bacterium]|nr:hypothetical protein [Bacteroidia bacterium]